MPNVREESLRELTESIAILEKEYKCNGSLEVKKRLVELKESRKMMLKSMRIGEEMDSVVEDD